MKIKIDIEPVEQARPRFAKRGKFVTVYDPVKVKNYKKELSTFIREYMLKHQIKQFENALSLSLVFYRKLPKTLSKASKRRKLANLDPPVTRPDLSNYLKSFEDALNGILWKDDNLICEEHIFKRYAVTPYIEMEIEEIRNDD